MNPRNEISQGSRTLGRGAVAPGSAWALVTGAGTGIGRCYALRLAALGYRLVIVGNNPAPLEAVAEEIRCLAGSEKAGDREIATGIAGTETTCEIGAVIGMQTVAAKTAAAETAGRRENTPYTEGTEMTGEIGAVIGMQTVAAKTAAAETAGRRDNTPDRARTEMTGEIGAVTSMQTTAGNTAGAKIASGRNYATGYVGTVMADEEAAATGAQSASDITAGDGTDESRNYAAGIVGTVTAGEEVAGTGSTQSVSDTAGNGTDESRKYAAENVGTGTNYPAATAKKTPEILMHSRDACACRIADTKTAAGRLTAENPDGGATAEEMQKGQSPDNSGRASFPEVRVIPMDLARVGAARELHDRIAGEGIEIDVVINNAGMFSFCDILSTPDERIERIILLHDLTVTQLCRLYAADMVRRGVKGHILNMSSYSLWMPFPGLALYSASKAYMRAFSVAFAKEVREKGIRVTAVCPAGVATDLYGLTRRWQRIGSRLGVLISPDCCARRGLRALWRGRRTVVPDWWNRAWIPLCKVLPMWLLRPVRRFTMKFQK